MKYSFIACSLLLSLLLVGCSKDYFSELRHPLEIQGSFDPVYGIPLARMSTNMADLVGMVDTSQAITVYVGEDDIVSFRYDYHQHATLSWAMEKGALAQKNTKSDTLRLHHILSGTEKIDLFEKLQDYDTNTLRINELLVSLEADVQGYVNSSFQEVLAEGCNLSFDSVMLKINCLDGYSETLPLLIATDEVSITQLIDSKRLSILKDHNIRHVVEHRPYCVEYAVRLCIALPANQLAEGSTFREQMNYIGVDSVSIDLDARLELPLNFRSINVNYTDTMELNLTNLEEQLRSLEQDALSGNYYNISLNDSNCYLALIVDNGLPLGLNFDLTFLDQYGMPTLGTIFNGDFEIAPSPVTVLQGYENTYASNGSTRSQFNLHLSLENLRQLSGTRKVAYKVNLNTSNPAGNPFVAVRGNDRLEVRSYVVVSPHAHISVPIDLSSLPFTK